MIPLLLVRVGGVFQEENYDLLLEYAMGDKWDADSTASGSSSDELFVFDDLHSFELYEKARCLLLVKI